jgi:2-succinyl-5-enolpyruvyl-6-hydroxy-3-cyclohexene-1-carboxylate synthase
MAGPAALALAAATGFPLLADPLSGARFRPARGAQVVAAYDLLLRSPKARRVLAPDLILRVGASPTSACLLAYLKEHEDRRQIVVDHGHRWKDHTASAHEYVRASPAKLLTDLALESPRVGDPAWRSLWEEAEGRTLEVLEAEARDEPMEGWILRDVVEAVPEETHLLVANSMPIRDLDAFGLPRQETLHVVGNRGASGIDGLVSTTVGIGLASGRPTLGVLGDLAFFHDMNGLLALRDLALPVGFVVVNNDGGGIFHTLPVREFEPAFTKLFATPHGLDFRRVAELYGIPFRRLASRPALRETLRELLTSPGPFIVEVPTSREKSHARRREILGGVEAALEGWDPPV